MKRSIGVLLSLCILLVLCVGCSNQPAPAEFKFKLPDNNAISLNAKQADMVQNEGLTEKDGAFQKNSETSINGVPFEYVSFSFANDQLAHAAYFSKQSDSYEEEGKKLISFFNEIYGPSQEHEGKDGYWDFTLESGERYSLSLDIQSGTKYVFLFLYRFA